MGSDPVEELRNKETKLLDYFLERLVFLTSPPVGVSLREPVAISLAVRVSMFSGKDCRPDALME
jgi:hypothetical protein